MVGSAVILYSHAASYCDITPSNTAEAIEAAINTCGDGSNVRFPLNASYTLIDTIYVRDRNNMVIDGNGSTFKITTDGQTKPTLGRLDPAYINSYNGGNWILLRGSNITLKNMSAVGSFPLASDGTARSLAAENKPEYITPNAAGRIKYSESMSNFGIYGTDGAYLEDLSGRAPWGDTVVTGPDKYVDNTGNEHGGGTAVDYKGETQKTGNYSKNVFVKRVHSEATSRMCYAFTSGYNIWLQDSTCKSGWYAASDQELDASYQPLTGVHILRNTWDGFGVGGILFPVAGPNIHDIELRDNVFLTGPDQPCNPSIVAGTTDYYNTNHLTMGNVSVENNTIVAYGTAIVFEAVTNGTIRNNKITTLTGAGCGTANGPAPLTKTANSTGIVVDNNGPDAPGAGGTATPPPPPPTGDTQPPAANINPNPGGTTTQPAGSCAPPITFAGTAGTAGSGRYDFTWTAASSATSYSLYFALPPDQPTAKYAGPFNGTAASAFGLTANTQYNFTVRANCPAGESVNSNVLTITVAAASTPPLVATTPTPPPVTNPPTRPTVTTNADLNHDGKIDFSDAVQLIRKWNTTDAAADLNHDGKVDFSDAILLIRNWKL